MNFACSMCGQSIINITGIRSNCEYHVYCSFCKENKDFFNKLAMKCKNCYEFYTSNKSFIRQYNCTKCKKEFAVKKFCMSHFYCQTCLNKNKFDKCKMCKVLKEIVCRHCLSPFEENGLKVKNPSHQEHQYCINCINLKLDEENSKTVCKECLQCYSQKEITEKICILCKKKNKKPHKMHGKHLLCFTCSLLIASYSPVNPYTRLISCGQCASQISFYIEDQASKSAPAQIKVSLEALQANYYDLDSSKHHASHFSESTNQSIYPYEESHKDTHILFGTNTCTYIPSVTQEQFSLARNIISRPPIICKVHSTRCYERLECKHLWCDLCITSNFMKKFEKFVFNWINKNLEWLSKPRKGIGCYIKKCFNKPCIPFDLLLNPALEILKKYNIHPSFTDHYRYYFEGVSMNFAICSRCNYINGYLFQDFCWSCSVLYSGSLQYHLTNFY